MQGCNPLFPGTLLLSRLCYGLNILFCICMFLFWHTGVRYFLWAGSLSCVMKLSLDPSPEICFWRSKYWFKGPSNQSHTQRSVTYHEMGYLTCGNRCVICLRILWSKVSNGWRCVQTESNRWTFSAVCLLSPHLYKHISAYKWRICPQGKTFLNRYYLVSNPAVSVLIGHRLFYIRL